MKYSVRFDVVAKKISTAMPPMQGAGVDMVVDDGCVVDVVVVEVV